MAVFHLPGWQFPLIAALVLLWLVEAWFTLDRLRQLPDLPRDGKAGPLPSVTLCIPARNEALEVGPALDSWLAMDHPGLRVVLVDDGSTDATPEILAERVARPDGRLQVIRNDTLPPGWLGKNHALDLASRQPEARGAEWLLFADADVHTTPDILRRAFAFLDQFPADILTLLPALDAKGWLERAVMPVASTYFLWLVPAGRVANPTSQCCCGVGGFILVRRRAYDAVSGHAGAPMDAPDDMKLAHRIKMAGYTNRVALGGPGLHLRYHHGPREIIQGLRKSNATGSYFFLLAPVKALATVVAAFGWVLPIWVGHPWWGLLLWLLIPPLMGKVHQRFTGGPADPAWALWPLSGALILAAIFLAFTDRLRGVNHWRGRDVKL